jgi:hypothetical protein
MVTSSEFLAGLRNGVAAAALAGLAGAILRRRPEEQVPLRGVAFAAAAVMALLTVKRPEAQVLVGFALLGAAGLVAGLLPSTTMIKAALAAPGAWFLAGSLPDVYDGWVRWLIFLAVALGAALMSSTDRSINPNVTAALLLVSIAGVYLDVPDTERILALLGVMTPLVLLGPALRLSRLGSAGSYMAVGILVWSATASGVGRPASAVAAAACLGALVLVPLAMPHGEARVARWQAVVAAHFFVVVVSSRVAGHLSSPLSAALIATSALVVGAWVIGFASSDGRLSRTGDRTP